MLRETEHHLYNTVYLPWRQDTKYPTGYNICVWYAASREGVHFLLPSKAECPGTRDGFLPAACSPCVWIFTVIRQSANIRTMPPSVRRKEKSPSLQDKVEREGSNTTRRKCEDGVGVRLCC